jgi:hypothetical protein
MASKKAKAKTKLTFAITVPSTGRSIKETRADIIRLLEQEFDPMQIKAYLLNKETSYG